MRVLGFGFRVLGLGSTRRSQGAAPSWTVCELAPSPEGCRVQVSRFRVRDLGFKVPGLGLRVQGLGFKV